MKSDANSQTPTGIEPTVVDDDDDDIYSDNGRSNNLPVILQSSIS